jgi:hypothetical protein
MTSTLLPLSSETRVLVAGHSHMFCLGAAQGYKGSLAFVPSAVRGAALCFLMDEWRGSRSAAYWDALVDNAAGRQVVLAFNGNQHYGDFLLQADTPFDFVEPTCPNAPAASATMLVPRRLVKAHFDQTLVGLRELIGRLLKAGAQEVVLLGSPAPKADNRRFMDVILNSEFMKEVARRRGLELQRVALTPEPILLKMWHVLQELMAESAASASARFAPTPEHTCGADGFLAEAYVRPGDLTHANDEFGRLMLALAVDQ